MILPALVPGHVADADARFVIPDRSYALAVVDGGVCRAAEVDEKGLVRFGETVTIDEHGAGLAGLAGGEGEGAAGGLVVAAARRGAVRRGVVEHQIDVGGVREGQREGGAGRAAVAFLDRSVTEEEVRPPAPVAVVEPHLGPVIVVPDPTSGRPSPL